MTMTLRHPFLTALSFAVLFSFAASERLVAQEAGTEAEAAAEEEVDHYALPTDAGIPELIEFIQQVRQPKTPVRSRAAMMEHFGKAAAVIDQAADKILAASPTEKQAVTAANEKMRALQMLGQLGNREARKSFEAFVEEALKSDFEAVRSMAKSTKLQIQLGKWSKLGDDERSSVVADLLAEVADNDVGVNQLRMVMQFAEAAERAGDSKTAISVIEKTMPKFANAADPRVAQSASSLEGLLNRLNLPGSKIELTGLMLDGSELDWEAYRGKVVLVDFWATWCGPCRAEIPNVVKAVEAYGDKGFTVLGISLDSKKKAVEEFMANQDLPWKTLYSDDPAANGWKHPMATKYGISGIPRAILVNQEGVVVHMNARGPVLSRQLEKLLGPAEGTTTDASGSDAAAATVGLN